MLRLEKERERRSGVDLISGEEGTKATMGLAQSINKWNRMLLNTPELHQDAKIAYNDEHMLTSAIVLMRSTKTTNGLVRGRVTDCGAMRDHGEKGGALPSAAVEMIILWHSKF